MRPIVEIQDIKFRYTKVGPNILDGISFTIKKGKFIGIMGLSGCGKSTLAFILNGAIPQRIFGVMEGCVLVEGDDTRVTPISKIAQKVGLVFQDPDNQLFMPTVEEEIAFGPENLCYSRDKIKHIVEDVIKKLNIEKLRHKNPSKLSGGQKRIVALGSILSLNTDVIILDETLSELDIENKKMILNTIKVLKKSGKTIILIDHNPKNLYDVDELIVISKGKIVRQLEGGKIREFLSGQIHDILLS